MKDLNLNEFINKMKKFYNSVVPDHLREIEYNKKERSVYVRIELEDKLPSNNGNYLTTIEYPDGKFLVKKSFYCAGKFKLKAGRRDAKVVNWFKRVVISEEDYQVMVK